MLSERAVESQKCTYLFLIDDRKAFDKERHEKLREVSGNLDLHGKDIEIIHNVYSEQTVYICRN